MTAKYVRLVGRGDSPTDRMINPNRVTLGLASKLGPRKIIIIQNCAGFLLRFKARQVAHIEICNTCCNAEAE